MRPTIKEIVDGMSWVLDERIAPITDDKWASSYLRSIKGLLRHISVRSELEAGILFEDITDQRKLLADVARLQTRHAVWQRVVAATRDALDRQWFDSTTYRSVSDMEAESLCYRGLISELITAIHEHPAGLEDVQRVTLHADAVTYLRRQMARERALYQEPFSGRPF